MPYLRRLSDQQQVGDDRYRYLFRAITGRFRGVSIGIESDNGTRAAAAVAYCASDGIVKVSSDSYLGTPIWFENNPPVGSRTNNSFALPSIDTY